MTREEAINALDIVEHMESFSILYEPGEPMNPTTVGELKEACRIAISALRAQSDTPPNDPLTPEELREMDGEPVWVVELNGYPPHWGLVYWCRKNKRNIVYVTINNGASICAETLLAAGGKIYRRKPEEAAP